MKVRGISVMSENNHKRGEQRYYSEPVLIMNKQQHKILMELMLKYKLVQERREVRESYWDDLT